MVRLTYSNRTESLLAALARAVDERRRAGADPLEPTHVVVPNRNMERYVEMGLAQAMGVAANLRFHRLERFTREWLEGRLGGTRIFDRQTLESRVLHALLDNSFLATPDAAPLASYLSSAGTDPDAVDLRRIQLALRLGTLFEEYGFSRPQLLDAWLEGRDERTEEMGSTERWQRSLYRHLANASGGVRIPMHAALRDVGKHPSTSVDPALHVFGVSYVARVFQWVFAALGQERDVHLYALNPCMEFWEDVPNRSALRPSRALARRGDRLATSELERFDAHPRVETGGDTPPLVLWGRPGREHIHMLNDLTGCDFHAAFRDPCGQSGPTLLTQLQRDILLREPERTSPKDEHSYADDRSIEVLACPGIRREVEAVADRIWDLIRGPEAGTEAAHPPLRFNDIAVLVTGAERAAYLAHVEAVFKEAADIPHNVVDLPLSAGSRVVEAALSLLTLPLGPFSRSEVLDVLTHPGVRGPDTDPDEWTALAARLGVFHGVSHTDHSDTYIDRDLFNWDQAIRRVALGAFMSGELSGDDRAFVHRGERYFPDEGGDARLGATLRSLCSDVSFARDNELTLTDWGSFLSGLFDAYLTPSSPREETDLRRCVATAAALGERDLGDTPVRYRIAAELARHALEGLSGGRGQYLADGVVVSSLMPMRAIPFRVIFVLGAGEGQLPAPEVRDMLDLRGRGRQIGDVSPMERDEYAFLETLLSARDRVILSYVARDPLSGDPLEPASVVRQLLDVVERGYLPGARSRLVRRVPLRRYEADDAPSSTIAEAHHEALARALGVSYRAAHPARAGRRPDPATALAELRESLGRGFEPLRRALRLCPVPTPHVESDDVESGHEESVTGGAAVLPATSTETVRMSLSHLRRFLESPVQGWAEAVLGVDEDPEEMATALDDEPMDASGLDAMLALRGAFVEALRSGTPLGDTYESLVERRQAHGRWPIGELAELRRTRDAQVLAAWERQFRGAGLDTHGLELARFGPGTEHAEADRLLPAIHIETDDPRAGHQGQRVVLELVGRTQPLVGGNLGSVLLSARSADEGRRAKALLDATLRRYLLRAFLDHVALSAARASGDGPHRAWLLTANPERAAPEERAMPAVAAEVARSWLASVAADLLGGSHAYSLPVDAVLPHLDDWARLDAAALRQSLESIRKQGGGMDRYGPVPNAAHLPAPDPELALSMVRRRFDLFTRCYMGTDT